MRKAFRILFKVLGWISGFVTIFGGIEQMLQGRFWEPYNFLGWLIWLGLTLIFFWAYKKLEKDIWAKAPSESDSVNERISSDDMVEISPVNNNSLFEELEIRELIQNCDDLGTMFLNSQALISTGNGRSEKMYETMMSYKCIFIYFFSEVLHYGKSMDFLADEKLKSHYLLSYNLVFTDRNAMRQCLSQLPSNWNDIITVINNLDLAGEREITKLFDGSITKLTAAFNKLSAYKS